MNYTSEMKQRLDQDAQYRRLLFPSAYLLTDAQEYDFDGYPFYGEWTRTNVGKYSLLVHNPAKAYHYADENTELALIGHALNPETGLIDEMQIAQCLVEAYVKGESAFYDELDRLTGVFVIILATEKELIAVQDCGGQKMLYFGKIKDHAVISSSPQLAADVFGLSMDREVQRLLGSRGYFRGSGFLPGNLSPYKELKRLGANTIVRYRSGDFKIERFFPRQELKCLRTEEDKLQALQQMHRLLSSTIELTSRKWQRAALSLTGGMDSKTALACAANQLSELHIFSFISKDSERLDAEAAERICSHLGVAHHLYRIPENPDQIKDYDFLAQLIEHNTSHICKIHPNEKRKYIFLERLDDFDVEIKSDISEIGRAYTTRKYSNVRIPRKLAPRHLTIGQGRYFLEPWHMRFADKAYERYMKETELTGDIFGCSMHDLSYWEVRMSSWAATSFASQEFFHEITIPYNNRNLMKLFLQFPEEERLQDIPHKRLMQLGCPKLAELEISVKDSYFGNVRMLIETVYYYYATRLNTCRSKL